MQLKDGRYVFYMSDGTYMLLSQQELEKAARLLHTSPDTLAKDGTAGQLWPIVDDINHQMIEHEEYLQLIREDATQVSEHETIAQREWHTRALVRIKAEYKAASVEPYRVRTFHPGEEIVMIQWGRAGRPIERNDWWTSTDIDGAFIIRNENDEYVEVVNIIDEISPFA